MQARLIIPVDSDAMHRMRTFVAAFAGEYGLDADEQSRIIIMLEELLTNLAKYGYANRLQPGRAEIALELEGTRLSLEFADDGDAFDPLAQRPPALDEPVEDRPVGGLGIYIVRALADVARYQRIADRNVLQLTRRVTVLARS